MLPPRRPPDELERVDTLRRTGLLDTEPELSFDSSAKLAAILCHAPIAFVSLVDEERQWFKARVGLAVRETPRDVSFCGHAILESSPFIVPDALEDPRFHDNPLVTGEPHLRFYAGVPLLSWQGYALGTLAVADRVARFLSAKQVEGLEILGDQVARLLDRAGDRPRSSSSTTETQAFALRGSTDGVWHWHPATGTLGLSRSFEELLGLEPRQVTTMEDYESLIHDADRARVAARLAEHLRSGARFDDEHRLRHRCGSYVWVHARGTALRGAHGQPLRMSGSVSDVTPRKQMEESLEAERETKRRLIDECPTVIVGLAPDGTTRFVNPAGERVTGWTAKELHGRSWWEVLYPEQDREQVRRFLRALEAGPLRDYELTLTTRSGERRTVAWTPWQRRDEHGALIELVGFGRDITVKKAAQRDLEREREAFRKVIDTALDAVVCTDATGRIIRWNAQAERTFGWKRMEALGHELADLIGGGARRSFPGGLPGVLAAEETILNRRIEATAVRRDGTEFPIEMAIVPIPGDGTTEFSVFVRDITDRKRAHDDLVAARAAAVAASQIKSQFLANMSHEIRTPMNGIIGMASVLLDTALTPSQRTYVEAVAVSADNLLAIVNDILDISKIEAQRLTIERVPFSLRETFRHAVTPLEARAREKGLRLSLEMAPDVADRRLGDPIRVGQILSNLVGNAIKFTARGTVTVRVAADPAGLAIAVEDTGIGIAPEVQARLFRPFVQADGSMTRRFGGTGLGLAICAELATLMGGTIGVTSEVGRGATFRVTLALEPAPVEADAPANAQAPRPDGGPSPRIPATRPLRLLLAEDNAINRLVATKTLERLGHDVVFAENGREALELIGREAFDLALIDVQMPELDGLEVARRVRAQELAAAARRLPLVAVTAHAMAGDRDRCLAAGMDDYITKPFKLETVAEVLARLSGDPSAPLPEPDVSWAFDRAEALAILGDDEEILESALDVFVASTPAVVEELRVAFAGDDPAVLHRAAHRLKGALLQLGLRAPAAALATIEVDAHAGRPVREVRARFAPVERGWRTLVESLRSRRGGVSSPATSSVVAPSAAPRRAACSG